MARTGVDVSLSSPGCEAPRRRHGAESSTGAVVFDWYCGVWAAVPVVWSGNWETMGRTATEDVVGGTCVGSCGVWEALCVGTSRAVEGGVCVLVRCLPSPLPCLELVHFLR